MKSIQPLDSSSPLPPSLFYDPNSVLDTNLANSPTVDGGAAHYLLPSLPWDLLAVPPLLPSDHWDPLDDYLLFEKDDLAPPLKSPAANYYDDPTSFLPCDPTLHTSFDRSHLESLIRASHQVQSGDLSAAHVMLTRLNSQFPAASGGALQRAAFHFTDALLSLLPFADPPTADPPFSAVELVRRVAAHKDLSDLSPIPQFAGLTANQTILETLAGARSIHLIDFDLGLGGQWSSFAQEIAGRSRAACRSPPPIRITAVANDDSADAFLAAENLREFGRGIGVRIGVDFVGVGDLAALGGRDAAVAVAVVLTPSVFRLLGGTSESAAAILGFVRRAAPRIVVFVDTEPVTAPFRRSFSGSLELYAAVLESLDAAAVAAGAGIEPISRIERSIVRSKIFSSVGSCWTGSTPWRELFFAAGMSPVAFSEFTESQAEWLVRRAPVEGFHVARREGSMVLTWRGREVVATSAWRC